MRIRILGTRGEIDASAPYHSRHSGVLVDTTLLLDLGEREFLDHNPEAVLITHLHPDHALFVRDKKTAKIQTPIYAPEPFEAENFVVRRFRGEDTVAGYRVRAIPTIHSLKVRSQAYLIEKNGRRLLYTGDLVWIEKEHHPALHDCNLIVTEASFMRKGGVIRRDKKSDKIYGHAGIPRLVKLFSRFSSHIVLVHFGSWFYQSVRDARRRIGALAREHGVTIDVGYDGMETTL